MSSVNAAGNFWSNTVPGRPDARVQRSSAPVTPSKVQTAEIAAGEADPAPSAVEVPQAVSASAPTAAEVANVATTSLLNLYNHALMVDGAGQNQSWVVVPPPQQADAAQVPQAAARTSAEQMARATYAVIASGLGARAEPERVQRQA